MSTTSPPSLTALTTYLLSTVGKAARGRHAAQLADRGMRLWHMAILAALADVGAHAQHQLAERLGMHVSDTAKVVDELERGGYVARERNPADRRQVLVTVTAEGRTTLAALTADAAAVQEDILAPLTARDRDTLHRLLLRLHTGL
ncbi:MAG: MarR family transcriptional regulator [Actinocatenispora sp.]